MLSWQCSLALHKTSPLTHPNPLLGGYTWIMVIFMVLAAIWMLMRLLDIGVLLMIEFDLFLLTRRSTPCWWWASPPLNYISWPFSKAVSPPLVHLTSASCRMAHLCLSSSWVGSLSYPQTYIPGPNNGVMVTEAAYCVADLSPLSWLKIVGSMAVDDVKH